MGLGDRTWPHRPLVQPVVRPTEGAAQCAAVIGACSCAGLLHAEVEPFALRQPVPRVSACESGALGAWLSTFTVRTADVAVRPPTSSALSVTVWEPSVR